MEKTESLEDFYQRKFAWVPENLRKELGHFNVFGLEPFVGEKAQPVPYKRRDFYKITLVQGHSAVHYADKVVEVKRQALAFSNPQIPYKWEHLDQVRGGCFCIFNTHFLHSYGNPTQYAVFQPQGTHLFELNDAQAAQVGALFERMFAELSSDYVHKYDVLRLLVLDLVHFALKMQPSPCVALPEKNAAQRIAMLFTELLERQFPIDDAHPRLGLRTASAFAEQLNVHVNHLNRAVKTVTQKTTSQHIAERVLQEAKILLKYSHWNVADIAYALGFAEVTHFNHFFKKHTQVSPLKFRQM